MPAAVRRPGETGSALILAVLITVLLSLIGLSYLMMARSENRIAENERNAAAALYVAEAGARLAVAWINDPAATGYLVPTTADMDRSRRIFDHDGNNGTARVQGVAGDAARPIYKDENFTAGAVFDRPYRGSLADTFLGIETGVDPNAAFAAMGPDVILNDAYLARVNDALFPDFPSPALRARITRIEVYAPPVVSIAGTATRMGIATLRASAGLFQYPGTADERQVSARVVKAVVNEIPIPGPLGPLQSCAALDARAGAGIHWGAAYAYGDARVPRDIDAGMDSGVPYAVNDPFTYINGAVTLAQWAAARTAAGNRLEDPWFRLIAGGAIDEAPNRNVQPWAADLADPANDHSNLFQHTMIRCPAFDYALWKSIAQSGLRGVSYYTWVSGPDFSLDGTGASTDFRTLTNDRTGLHFFDTRDGLEPNVAGSNLTPPISISGGSYGARGFLYLNAASFGSGGLGGVTRTLVPPGEPGDASGFVNLDYPGSLGGSYAAKSGAIVFKTFQDPVTGDWYCTDAATCTAASRTPAGAPVKDDHGLPFVADVVLDGVLYTSGTFELQGNASHFGSVVAQRGVIDGGGTPGFYFDERLIKGEWPPKGMPLPRVVVSGWETDR
jgi:Tfp pilus assembly protein PilX